MTFLEKLNSIISRYFIVFLFVASLLAAFLRAVNLGAIGLTDHEASLAFQAFKVANGQDVMIGGQPGYVGLTSLLFTLFESSNFLARLWPALLGIMLVIVPILFRKHIGDLAVVILAFLIAFEPGLVALSRSSDGTMITIASLLLAIGLFENRKLVSAGLFAGLAVVGSENIWPLSITLAVSWLLVYWLDPDMKRSVKTGASGIEKSGWLRFTLAALISMLLVSSQYLLHPGGVSGIGSTLTDYLAKWQVKTDLGQGQFLLVLLVTQFPALILGIWGLVKGLREKMPFTRLLGLWWIIGLLLAVLMPGKEPLQIAMINIPIFVLAAMQTARLIEGLAIHSKFVFTAETIVTISLLLFSILNFLNMINFPPGDTITMRNQILGTFIPLALWIAFTVLLAWGWDAISSKSGVVVGLGLMLGVLLVGCGWKSADLGSRPQSELLANTGFIVGQNHLLQTVEDISLWNNGQKKRIDVQLVGMESPSIAWTFRDFEKTIATQAFPVTNSPSIVVSGVDAVIQTQSLYRGQMVVWSLQPDYALMQWQDWFKWIFNRQVPLKKTNILLWVRNDLFKDTAAIN